MRHYDDEPMYRTFAEFEREELRRADSVGSVVDELFDELFVEELSFAPSSDRAQRQQADGDEEE
jgi:hypothetical protein